MRTDRRQTNCFAAALGILGLSLSLHACGLLGSKGNEPKGDEHLPLSGVGPYLKEDQDCQVDFVQPIFMSPPDAGVYWGEPCAAAEGGSEFRLFFEERRPVAADPREAEVDIVQQRLEIVPAPADSCRTRDIRFLSPSGERLPEPQPTLVLRDAGAPALMREGGLWRMWYGMENGLGIGYAEFREDPDGDLVLQEEESLAPVLAPSEAWEGGYVGSPSVLRNPVLGTYQLYYEGNIFCDDKPPFPPGPDVCHRAIGYATSPDGISWTKRDAAGRNSADHPGAVEPLLTPTQTTWETHYPSQPRSGTLGTPHVILHRSPVRTLYYLYYTGNLQGHPVQLPPLDFANDVDTSIGLAGSMDGVNWVKASVIQEFGQTAWEVNPILNEVFPLDVVNKLWIQLGGPGYQLKVQGSSNVFFPPVVVDEIAPCVLDLGTAFFMFFEQISTAISFEPEPGQPLLEPIRGLAFALVEREG